MKEEEWLGWRCKKRQQEGLAKLVAEGLTHDQERHQTPLGKPELSGRNRTKNHPTPRNKETGELGASAAAWGWRRKHRARGIMSTEISNPTCSQSPTLQESK